MICPQDFGANGMILMMAMMPFVAIPWIGLIMASARAPMRDAVYVFASLVAIGAAFAGFIYATSCI